MQVPKFVWRLGVDESEFCRGVLFGEVLPETNVRLDNVVRRVSFLCVYNADEGAGMCRGPAVLFVFL